MLTDWPFYSKANYTLLSVSDVHAQEQSEKAEAKPYGDKEIGELELLNQKSYSGNGVERTKRKRRMSYRDYNRFEEQSLERKHELVRGKLHDKPFLKVTPIKGKDKTVKVNNPKDDNESRLTPAVEKNRNELAQKNSHSHQKETEFHDKLEVKKARVATVHPQPVDELQRGCAREALNSNSQNMSFLNHIPAHTQSSAVNVLRPQPVYPPVVGHYQHWRPHLAVQNHLPADINPWRHLNAAPAMSTQYVAPGHSSIMPEQMYGAYAYNFQALQPMTDRCYLEYFYFWALQNQARIEENSLANVNSDAARVSTPTVPMIHTAVSEEPSQLDCDTAPVNESNPIGEDLNRSHGFGRPVFPGMI